jgi:chromosome segregation ATPase
VEDLTHINSGQPSERDLLIVLLSKVSAIQESLQALSRRQDSADKERNELFVRVQTLEHQQHKTINDVTSAHLEANKAYREAQGVGKSLDTWRDEQERAQANLNGQLRVVRWASSLAMTIVVALVISYLTGILNL